MQSKEEKNIGYYDLNTGEDLDKNIVDAIRKEDFNNKWMIINKKISEDPNSMTLEEIDMYMNANNIKPKKMMEFKRYYRSNEELDLRLFDKGISKNGFFYFKYLVSKHCSLTYTLKFGNNVSIKKDEQISETLGITVRAWRSIKKELIDLNLIKVINFEGNKYFKVNPCYIGKNKMLTPHTYHAFRNDLIDNELLSNIQILWWDKFMLEEYHIIYKGRNEQKLSEKLIKSIDCE